MSRENRKSKPTSPLVTSEKKTYPKLDTMVHDKFPIPHPPVLPPVQKTSKKNSKSNIPTSPSSVNCDKLRDPDISSACSSCAQRRKLPSLHDMSERISRLNNKSREKGDLNIGSRSRRRILKPIGNIEKADKNDILTSSIDQPLPDINTTPSEVESYKKLLNWMQPKTNEKLLEKDGLRTLSNNKRRTPDLTLSSRLRSVNLNSKNSKENLTHLPPVHQSEKRLPPSLSGKKKTRCAICMKKLGIASTYQCRCGSKFCATHRYPETHTCSYDYKTEGRKFLEKNNPVVTAPKLPKI